MKKQVQKRDPAEALLEAIFGTEKSEADPSAPPAAPEDIERVRTEAAKILDLLRPVPTATLEKKFGLGKSEFTLDEIGQEFDVTRERIKAIEEKALKLMSPEARTAMEARRNAKRRGSRRVAILKPTK